MNFRQRYIRNLVCLVLALLAPAFALPVSAQEYVQLTPFSKLYCVYLPNGKTQIARSTGPGKFRKISFDKARELSADLKAKLRQKQKKLSAIRKKLIDQQKGGSLFGKLSKKEVKAIVNLVQGVNPDGDISALIADIDQSISGLQSALQFQNTERTLINNCEKRKLPPISSMEITYEALIAEDTSFTPSRWSGVGLVFMSAPTYQLPGFAGNALCLTFQNGVERLVSFVSDPAGAYNSLLSYQSNHILVRSGETARLLPRDGQNRVTRYGYVVAGFGAINGVSKKDTVTNQIMGKMSEMMGIWGTSAAVVRAKYNRKQNKLLCPNFGK